jgi:uncharacterized protein
MLKFEWDAPKSAANLRKHGVSCEEAATVFGDPLALTFADPDHSVRESRFITIEQSHQDLLMIVAPIERGLRSGSPAHPGRPDKSEQSMSRVEDMRAEYHREDLGAGARGKYFRRYSKSTHVVLLDDRVAQVFPKADAVNEALLGLLALAEKAKPVASKPRKRST